jgi:hypothetical protein
LVRPIERADEESQGARPCTCREACSHRERADARDAATGFAAVDAIVAIHRRGMPDPSAACGLPIGSSRCVTLGLVADHTRVHACRVKVLSKAVGVAVVAVFYGIWVRPRLLHWGATDEEVTGPYPGAALVPDGKRGATMAVTIEAPPEQIWPWLVQMGGDRAGWYSWDRLDNAGRPSAHEVHPEWQDLHEGDYVKYRTPRGVVDAWKVAALEPNRFLGLHGFSDLRGRRLDPERPRPTAYTEGLWGFLLSELPGGRTRLVIGGYEAFRPRWLERYVTSWLFVPVVWIMQARMLVVLKRNIERTFHAG